MTNQEWRRSRDVVAMIQGLLGVTSRRKGSLYLCAGCRSIWNLLFSESSRRAVEVAERYADGRATDEEFRRKGWEAECPTFGNDFEPGILRELGLFQPQYKDYLDGEIYNLVRMGVLTERQIEEDKPEVAPIIKDRLISAAFLAYATCNSNFSKSG